MKRKYVPDTEYLVNIHGFDWKIKFTARSKFYRKSRRKDFKEIIGCCEYATKIIYVDKYLDPAEKFEVLCHELGHAIFPELKEFCILNLGKVLCDAFFVSLKSLGIMEISQNVKYLRYNMLNNGSNFLGSVGLYIFIIFG